MCLCLLYTTHTHTTHCKPNKQSIYSFSCARLFCKYTHTYFIVKEPTRHICFFRMQHISRNWGRLSNLFKIHNNENKTQSKILQTENQRLSLQHRTLYLPPVCCCANILSKHALELSRWICPTTTTTTFKGYTHTRTQTRMGIYLLEQRTYQQQKWIMEQHIFR